MGIDEITQARIRREGANSAEALDAAIDAAAHASLDCDDAMAEAEEIVCQIMWVGVVPTVGNDSDDVVEVDQSEVHAMARGLVQKHVQDRIHTILSEAVDEDDDGDEDAPA